MSVDTTAWFVALLAAFWLASKGASAKVEEFPPILKVSIGGNGSMYCKFPILQGTAEVSWWKEGENSFIKPDSRNQFNVKKDTFTLLNVKYTDVGRYRCQVKSRQQILGNGSGTQLIVLIPPTPLKIIRIEETSPKSRKLVCKTTPFYPKEVDIFWRRNNMEILTKIETSIQENSEGFFEASSTLEDTQSAQGKVLYVCLVSHETLKIPASFSYIVDQVNSNDSLIFGERLVLALGVLAFMILIIILITIGVKARCGIQRTSAEAIQSGEPTGSAPVEHNLDCAARNVRENKRIHHVRRQDDYVIYAKTRRGGDQKLTYAALQLASNKKISS